MENKEESTELQLYNKVEYNDYTIITKDTANPSFVVPNTDINLNFYQTRQSLLDPERYKHFLKNAEQRFRSSQEYKTYKSLQMARGFDHSQFMGNIESSKEVDIELHHNIIGLFDIVLMISEHILNTVGLISTFDLIQLVINEHFEDNVPCCMLSTTEHEMFTNDPNAYIGPDKTFGKWWVLLEKYRFGITYEIADKVIKYLNKYQSQMPDSINVMQQEQILSFAYYNQYGVPKEELQYIGMDVPPMLPDGNNYMQNMYGGYSY